MRKMLALCLLDRGSISGKLASADFCSEVWSITVEASEDVGAVVSLT